MERIKSALEIALEKTAHIKRASAEELRRQKEEDQVILASSTVQKYLRGEYKLKDLAIIAERQPEKELIQGMLWEQLVAAISLERCENVLEGLEFLAMDKEAVRQLTNAAREIIEEFDLEKSVRLSSLHKKIEQNIKLELSRQGISGSSIDIDAEATPQWHQAILELEAFIQAKLELVKEGLVRLRPTASNLLPERHK